MEIPLKGPKLIALKTAELALGKVLLEPIFSFSQAIEVIKRVLVLFDTSSQKILLPQNSHREKNELSGNLLGQTVTFVREREHFPHAWLRLFVFFRFFRYGRR